MCRAATAVGLKLEAGWPKTSQAPTSADRRDSMIPAPIPTDDERRLQALREMLILDTPPEERFDRVVRFAADEFDMPIVLVSLVDAKRQWFKARVGMAVCETERDISFCGHVIVQPQILVVEDALQDERFHDNPLVAGPPHVRFYAGAPLQLPTGEIIGTLCMIDHQPRTLDPMDLAIFGSLRELVVGELVSQEVTG
jgi:GAF domain-containing protein